MRKTELEEKPPFGSFSRRIFVLRSVAAGLAGGLTLAARQFSPDLRWFADSLRFLNDRTGVGSDKVFTQPDFNAVLSRQVSDKLFEDLNLDLGNPGKLDRETFAVIAQKPARLARLYFSEDEGVEGFFTKLKRYSELMGMDFVSVLLMYQISGDATSSAISRHEDVRDERLRVGLSVAEHLVGSSVGLLAVNALRESGLGTYYAMARIEGPVTLGIHDIETVFIARALINLEKNFPKSWSEVSRELAEKAPNFFAQYKSYVSDYDEFEALSGDISHQVVGRADFQSYLKKFQEVSFMTQFLTSDGAVDPYQLMRTTHFWARISELDQLALVSFYQSDKTQLEKIALDQTVEFYLSSQGASFFMDQIANPRMVEILRLDAASGDHVAAEILGLTKKFIETGDKIITKDRSLAEALAEDKTEQNLDFQLMTGTALARLWLQEAVSSVKGVTTAEIKFSNSQELGYFSFLANGLREISPSYSLSGERPLHAATLPFLPPRKLLQTMGDFINEVYNSSVDTTPEADFREFSRHFLSLLEERYFSQSLGAYRFQLEKDKEMGHFIKRSESWGVYQRIITLPHCSWMRALEATIGYIATI